MLFYYQKGRIFIVTPIFTIMDNSRFLSNSNLKQIYEEEDEKIPVLLPNDIQASFMKKKSSRILPDPEVKLLNTLNTKKKTNALSQGYTFHDPSNHSQNQEIKTTSDILVIGTSGAGKSLLLRRLRNLDEPVEAETLPTMGTDIENIQINKKNILFREVGFKLVQSWMKFSKETKAILFLVDLTSYASLSASVIEFYNLLLGIGDLSKPIVLVLNKIDCGDHMDLDFVLQSFEFYELLEAHENLYLYVISVVTGVNLKALADLISSLVHSDGKEKISKKKKTCCF